MAQSSVNQDFKILVIGGSAGSLEVLLQLLPLLNPELKLAIVIVVHRKGGESVLTELLNDKTSWEVMEAEEKDSVQLRKAYVAPADYHLLIESNGSLSLDASEKIHYSRPAIDATFETAAEVWGSRVIGILLSGANSDGAEGLKMIADAGGITIVQDPKESTVAYMPQQALALFKPDYVENTRGIAALLNKLGQ